MKSKDEFPPVWQIRLSRFRKHFSGLIHLISILFFIPVPGLLLMSFAGMYGINIVTPVIFLIVSLILLWLLDPEYKAHLSKPVKKGQW